MSKYNNKKSSKEEKIHPPAERYYSILNQYYVDLEKMPRIEALVKFKNRVQRLYSYYNPDMIVKEITEEQVLKGFR